MSHTVQVKNVQITNEHALRTACENLQLPISAKGKHRLYGGNTGEGFAVNLPGWQYPVVIDCETGEAKYDNFGGSWGKQEELDTLVQRYVVEAAIMEASMSGITAQEEQLENGDIRLVLTDMAQ